MSNKFNRIKSRKICKKYYFSVEGDTEKWYLEHLQKLINCSEKAKYTVKFVIEITDPVSFVKNQTIIAKSVVNHIIDVESKEQEHKTKFLNQLSLMKNAQGIGKQIKYKLGYSNFTFDLWVILHKQDCFASLSHRDEYKRIICNAYNYNFKSLKEYKSDDIFHKKVLNKISLDDVMEAVKRGNRLQEKSEEKNFKKFQHCGFCYYDDNPSMSIWQIIGDILKECDLL